MHIVIVDINDQVLDGAVESIKAVDGVGEVWGLKVDVSKIDEVVAMREMVFDEFGEVSHQSLGRDVADNIGSCSHGECWYWTTNTSHVHHNRSWRTTEELV